MPWPIIRPAPSASPLRHAVCLLLSTSLLTACATLPGEPVARQSIERSAARAYYSGPLDWEGVHRLQALAQGVRIRVLEVDSQGVKPNRRWHWVTGYTATRSIWRSMVAVWAVVPITCSRRRRKS